MVVLIEADVFSWTGCIDDDASPDEFKKDAMIADAQTIFVPAATQFLHVAAQVLLQEMEPEAHLAANVLRQSPERRLGFVFDLKLVFHR
jgi:hypothetical protein